MEPNQQNGISYEEPAADAEFTDSGFSWQASEYVFRKKSLGWHVWLLAGLAVLLAVAILTRQYLTVGVFAAMAGALLVYANKPPQVMNYSLTDTGLMIESKYYPYNQFRSFSILQEQGWHTVDLEPTKRFMPRLSMLFEDDERDQIVQILSQHMPRADRQPDIIDRIARKLKF